MSLDLSVTPSGFSCNPVKALLNYPDQGHRSRASNAPRHDDIGVTPYRSETTGRRVEWFERSVEARGFFHYTAQSAG